MMVIIRCWTRLLHEKPGLVEGMEGGQGGVLATGGGERDTRFCDLCFCFCFCVLRLSLRLRLRC